MTRGLRFWMSGCVAVISLALAGVGDAWADEDGDTRSTGWVTSRFDMAQTLQRLQDRAPNHGLTLMAHWAPQRGGVDKRVRGSLRAGLPHDGRAAVLVFAGAGGGTPVLMTDDRARPDLPLSLRLRNRSDGLAEVLLRMPPQIGEQELPGDMARDLFELPGLVADALG